MRVLTVSHSFPKSKDDIVSSFVYDEVLGLIGRNVKAHVARGVPSIRHKRRNLIVEGIYIHNFSRRIDASILSLGVKGAVELPVASLFHPETIFFTLPYSWFIFKLVKMYNIDLIHAHFAYPAGFAALLTKKVVGKPLIVTLHGVDILTEPSINYGIRLKKRFDTMVRKVLNQADKVFAASKFVYQEAIHAGCDEERLALLPNAVNLEEFNPNVDGSFVRKRFGVAHRPIIFTLRGHEAKNGIEYLIRAIPLVSREVPDAVFLIGGDGPLRIYHERLTRKLKIDERCIFTGRIPQKELPFYYAACDIFVIPSLVEAFGLVTIEAMACGKPVIGSNVGGIPDIVIDGYNGFLIRPRDPQQIAERIVELIENPELRIKMGLNGRKTVKQKFSLEKRLDKILSVYCELV